MIKIYSLEDCCGCSACANQCPTKCISMKNDAEGFLYPEVDVSACIGCGLCEKVCPMLQIKATENEPISYAACNKNENNRRNSTSGGAFSALAETVIKAEGFVFGACFDHDFQVVHQYTDCLEGLLKFRGSKYVQSRIEDSFQQAKTFLKNGKVVLFSGTPCQIAGLQSFLGKEYENLYCIDFICRGVPSPELWRKYLAYQREKSSSSIRVISFRNKTYGYESSTMAVDFNNGKKYRAGHESDFMLKAFTEEICSRPSCYQCRFKTIHRQSDITLGDGWDMDRLTHDFDYENGISLVLVNSEKGRSLLGRSLESLNIQKVDMSLALQYNGPMIDHSAVPHPKRQEFFKDFDRLSLKELIQKYTPVSKKDKLKCFIKPILFQSGLLHAAKKILSK